jgi:hypothetical protein
VLCVVQEHLSPLYTENSNSSFFGWMDLDAKISYVRNRIPLMSSTIIFARSIYSTHTGNVCQKKPCCAVVVQLLCCCCAVRFYAFFEMSRFLRFPDLIWTSHFDRMIFEREAL